MNSRVERSFMLHLNRKKGEVIHLIHNQTGEQVDLVILEVKGKIVKIGFENDTKTHTILRKEVRQAQQKHTSPNPWYKDQKPTYNNHESRLGIKNIPMVDMQKTVDGLEQLVDELIPTTEEPKTVTAVA